MPARPNQKFISGEGGIEFALLPFLPSKLVNMGRPIFIQKFLGVPNVTVQLLNMLTVSTRSFGTFRGIQLRLRVYQTLHSTRYNWCTNYNVFW